MMRSLYSGISGLRNHQTRMDVIGNNVSNVNTVGFKADWQNQTIDGIVTRISVENGQMFARIEREDGSSIFVPVGAIYDIRQPGTSGEPMKPPVNTTPPAEEKPGEGEENKVGDNTTEEDTETEPTP